MAERITFPTEGSRIPAKTMILEANKMGTGDDVVSQRVWQNMHVESSNLEYFRSRG